MKHLAKLRKLPENKRCATCTHEERMGFNTICMKFKIFICGDCKSAHAAFSHRCKVCTRSLASPRLAPPELLPPSPPHARHHSP